MCGIGGFFALRPVAPGIAAAMRAALAPRGPDAEHAVGWNGGSRAAAGPWQNALVHARLSIIDPRPDADQPMANEAGDVWIVYNGEVYDWQRHAAALRAQGVVFRTRSDTEFILRGYEAWGIDTLLERLRGMFAFAILDTRRARLYLARDRLGEKPLVYACAGEELAFGSTVRAVLPFVARSQRTLSREGIDAYLAHRYVPAPRTIFGAVQRLENGHYLEFDLQTRRLAKRRYWHPAPQAGSWLEALDESVRMRTIADRPLGVFLSSGVDSAVIASRLASQGLTGHRTFTAAFPGSEMDEAPLARETAHALGLDNSAVEIPRAVGADFARVVASLDEPFADPSSFPTWYLARETARHVKVVLVGDGGDELFAGYKRLAQHLRSAWRGAWRLPRRPRPSLAGAKLLDELAMPWEQAYTLRFSGFTPSQRAFLHAGGTIDALTYWRAPDWPARDKLERLSAIDYANYLPEYILRKSDLCTMAHGLEARAPMLDHELVQRILALPARERYTRPPKRALAQALDARVRGAVFGRRKRGFNPPLGGWLRGDLAERLDGLGARLEGASAGQLARRAVDAFAGAYRQGEERLAEQVLQLLILDESLAQLRSLAP